MEEQTIIYAVGSEGTKLTEYTDLKVAAKAFKEIPESERPLAKKITRTLENGIEFENSKAIAGTQVIESGNKKEYTKWVSSLGQNKDFSDAYKALEPTQDYEKNTPVAGINTTTQVTAPTVEEVTQAASGFFNLAGKQATSIRFERSLIEGLDPTYTLRFFDGRKVIDRAENLTSADMVKMIGKENVDSILSMPAERSEAIENGIKEFGILKGEKLKNFSQDVAEKSVSIPSTTAENAIEPSRAIEKDVQAWLEKNWKNKEFSNQTAQHDADPFAEESAATVTDSTTPLDAGEQKSNKAAKEMGLDIPVPPHIAEKFKQQKNKYFYTNKPEKLAFEDKGIKITSQDSSPIIAESMVEIAMARGWNSIRARGSNEFKREVWLAAQSNGIEVVGYSPSEADKEQLAKLLEQKGFSHKDAEQRAHSNSIEPTQQAEKDSSADFDSAFEKQRQNKGKGASGANILSGELLSHGNDFFDHDKKNDMSYFVKVKQPDGTEKTVWGKDLSRAVSESGANVGDSITLNRGDRETVQVMEKIRDADGNVIKTQPKSAELQRWQVEKATDFRNLPRDAALEKHPDLIKAHAALASAEALAKRYPGHEAKILSKVQDGLAKKIERGEPINPPKVNASRLPQEKASAPQPKAPSRDLER